MAHTQRDYYKLSLVGLNFQCRGLISTLELIYRGKTVCHHSSSRMLFLSMTFVPLTLLALDHERLLMYNNPN